MIYRWLLVIVLLLLIGADRLPPGSPQLIQAAEEPSSASGSAGASIIPGLALSLSQSSGPAGMMITLTGSGAVRSGAVTLYTLPWFFGEDCAGIRTNLRKLTTVPADRSGRFSARVAVSHIIPTDKGIIIAALPEGLWPRHIPYVTVFACFTFDPAPVVGYFPQTGYVVGHGFLAFWQQFGGLPVFGHPLTDEILEQGRTVQYFERARFEWHPGVAPERYDVLLGRLGSELTAPRHPSDLVAFQPMLPDPKADCVYVPETQHNLCAGFRAYWETSGGLSLFGYPISDEFIENRTRVQYFERARFEWRPPPISTGLDVWLGPVGAEFLRGVGPVPATALQPSVPDCLAPPSGEYVELGIRGDRTEPRCLQVLPTQRLSFFNYIPHTKVQVRLGRISTRVNPLSDQLLDAAFGSYLQPGVHQLQLSVSHNPIEVWVIEPS